MLIGARRMPELGDAPVAVITGANGHIGSALALRFIREGWGVLALDYEQSQIPPSLPTPGAFFKFIPCDLEDEEARNQAIREILCSTDRVDCLVNCAAFVGTSELEGWNVEFVAQGLETWRRALEVNLTAPFHLSRDLAPLLTRSTNGSIINVGSIYGEFGPNLELYEGLEMHNPAAYAASKAALVQLTRWLSTVLAPNVRVNVVSPGGLLRDQPPKFVERYTRKVPLGRMATEGDVVESIYFLASPAASYITGHVLRVDGGWGVW